MATSHKYRNSEPQKFTENAVLHWQQMLKERTSEEVSQLFQAILHPNQQQSQLQSAKKINSLLKQCSSSKHSYVVILKVLVEIHSSCMSRHPLQRAIASVLQSVPEPDQTSIVVTLISTSIKAMLSECTKQRQDDVNSAGEHISSSQSYSQMVMESFQYIEALMENCSPGEAALKTQLPMVVDYCVSTIASFSQWKSVVGVLIEVMKITMNVLQKFALVLHSVLDQNCVGTEKIETNSSLSLSLTWPVGMSEVREKGVWLQQKLSTLAGTCEEMLIKADTMPHDATVTAAMLSVVVFNLQNHTQENQFTGCSAKVVQWLSPGQLSQFAKLTICHALLAKLPAALMVNVQLGDKPLLLYLFPVVCKLFDSFTESSDRYISSRTLTLWSCVAKDCLQEEVATTSTASPFFCCLQPSGEIMQTMLHYVWSLWEDPIDGIRHQCKDMFENMIRISQNLQLSGSKDFLFSLCQSLLSLDSPTRGKYILLSTLSQHLPVKKLIGASPSLPNELMSVMGQQALACHAGELWSRLIDLHWKLADGDESEELVWKETWVCVLVQGMCHGSQLARRHISQHCLPSVFHCTDKSMDYINSYLQTIDSVSVDEKLTTQLSCLRCAKTEDRDFTSLSVDSFADLFNMAMHHIDEQIQLSALGLICESYRTTEPPCPSHLKLLLQFIELNGNTQSPSFRYPALTAFKQVLVRIKDSSYAMLKLYQKRRDITSPDAQIVAFQDFLLALMNQQFEVIHPLSSFQRRHFSLSILQLLATIFEKSQLTVPTDKAENISPIFVFSSAVSESQATSLLDGLRDPYDANRSVCLELLLKLPLERIKFNDTDFIRCYTIAYYKLAVSPKSVNCASASYLLRLLVNGACAEFNRHFEDLLNREFGHTLSIANDEREEPPSVTLQLLCNLAEYQLKLAEKDLVNSSMTAPMYGAIQSLRTITRESTLLNTNPKQTVFRASFKPVGRIVNLCQQVAKIVSPVVCSSSPEGFLPDSIEENSVSIDTASSVSPTGNAQSLLLCCWHCMKEIALLLGYLTEFVPVVSGTDSSCKEDSGIITHTQLDVIADIFIHQLTEAKHRGAFEMAYTGFLKLCRCMWTSSSQELNQKPLKWVEDLLDSLQSTSIARLLSFTRRSAGLPFFLQAILTTEPNHTSHACLKSTMKVLLQVASQDRDTASQPYLKQTSLSTAHSVDYSSSGCSLETSELSPSVVPSLPSKPAAVHALNILRALYRDSRLAEYIVSYIPKGVMIAIEGFAASLWPVRNSSTLLFSALVSRIFGAKRVQDEHSMENKLTAKEFFTRFPSLYSFLLQQLEVGAAKLNNPDQEGGALQLSLFPVLLLLSRLYVSPLDEANSPTSLKPFLPLLVSCTCCVVWKTRILVSRALTSIITNQNSASLIQDLYDKMSLVDQNTLHGLLLVVERILKERPKLLRVSLPLSSNGDGNSDGGRSMTYWLILQHLDKKWIGLRPNKCGITRCLYIEILTHLLEQTTTEEDLMSKLNESEITSIGELVSEATQLWSVSSLKSNTSQQQLSFEENVSITQLKLVSLAVKHPRLSLYAECDKDNLQEEYLRLVIGSLKSSNSIAVRRQALEYLVSSLLCQDEDSCTMKDGAQEVVHLLVEMVQCESDPDLLIQAYALLATDGVIKVIEDLEKVFSRAFQMCLQSCNRLELKLSLIDFVSSALAETSLCEKYLQSWLSHLEQSINPTQPYEIRVTVASQAKKLWTAITTSQRSTDTAVTVGKYSNLVLNLLQDTDGDVRDKMAGSVGKLLPSDLQLASQSPSPASALKMFITSLPTLVPDLEVCFRTLILLIPDSESKLQLGEGGVAHRANPLFDEDPVNDYEEDVVVLQHVASCLLTVVARLADSNCISRSHFESVVGTFHDRTVTSDSSHYQTDSRLARVVLPSWNRSRELMLQAKRKFLGPVLELFHAQDKRYRTELVDFAESLDQLQV